MLNIFIVLIVMMTSQAYTYDKANEIVHLKYMQLTVHQLYLNKAVKIIFKKFKCQYVSTALNISCICPRLYILGISSSKTWLIEDTFTLFPNHTLLKGQLWNFKSMAEGGDPKGKRTGEKTTCKILKSGNRWVVIDLAQQRREREIKAYVEVVLDASWLIV